MRTSTRTRRRAMVATATVGLLVALNAAAPSARQATTTQKPPTAGAPAPTAAPPVTALTDTGWPRQITSGQTVITIYEPQIDSWDGFRLAGRAAAAVREGTASAPVYGILHFKADTITDKDQRMVTLEKFTVAKAAFPTAGAKSKQWVSIVEQRASRLNHIALDRLEAAVAVATETKRGESMPLRNDPPKIVLASVPSMLVLVDGEPQFRDVPGTSLQRVLNTRPLLLRDKSGTYYLKVFDGWMESPSLATGWTVAAKVPSDCDVALKDAIQAKVADLLVGGDPSDPSSRPSLKTQAPRLLVETTPTELIVTEGEPKYTAIEGTGLLYAENTTGNIFIDTKNQRAYVLVSGRWFSGPASTAGPWTFVPGDQLPPEFKAIPDSSPKENVKASIPGTPQAEEAIVANSIPQTAKVRRRDAQFNPTFDGAPKLESIQGTTLRYVVNASLPIVAVGAGTDYFGVQNGVWFVSTSLTGPWLVATTIPAEIYAIPPSSPLHYVTYVRVYDYTPDYVVVGYTPGYYGAYVSGGCVVYGTGFYYTPWIGTVWYGPPVTYGFGVSIAYTPWTGWHMGFGFGWSWGVATVSVGWGWGAYPWWGPAGWGWGYAYPWVYSPVYGAAWGPYGGGAVWGPGYWSGTTGNIYHRWGSTTAVTRSAGGFDAWTGNRWAGQTGMAYNSRTGTIAAGQRAAVGNVYSGNYAAGARGAAYNPSTGFGAVGSKVDAGNAYTGRNVEAGRGAVVGPGGNVTGVAGIRGDDGGVARVGNNVYAGHDGNVYRHDSSGGWQHWSDGGWQTSNLGQNHQLDRERGARGLGQSRWDGFNRGGFRSAGGMRGGFRGGRRR